MIGKSIALESIVDGPRTVVTIRYATVMDFLVEYCKSIGAGFVDLGMSRLLHGEVVQVCLRIDEKGVACSLDANVESIPGYRTRALFHNSLVVRSLAASLGEAYEVDSDLRICRRRAPRVSERLLVTYYSNDELLADVCLNFSRDGMFIRTDSPLPEGRVVKLAAILPTGEEIRIGGKVMRVVPEGPGRGMGIRFLRYEGNSREKLTRYVERALGERRAREGNLGAN